MPELIAVGFIAGMVAGISPCILPVLPVVLVAGVTSPGVEVRHPRARAVAVVVGLIVSFSVLILVGSEVLSLLHLPQDLLRDVGIALLVLVGIGFVVPPVGMLLERPFARIGSRQPNGKGGGFVVGLALGALFVPCAGPVLSAITLVGSAHEVGLTSVFLTLAFAVGAGVPLLAVAVAGEEIARRAKLLRRHGPVLRRVGGVVLIVMALTIGFNTFAGLQRDVPGYTNALQSRVEGSENVHLQLNAITGEGQGSLAHCDTTALTLVSCGSAPAFKGITDWLNTPGERPITISSLRGKVVLVDFWTYSCINCQRALPHVEAWDAKYAKDGLVVVGVHTPEFAFEHVVSNVKSEAAQLGVHYPIAIDNNYGTWTAYHNQGWPAEYLIDASGVIRHVDFGEGEYGTTEGLIRQLLRAANPDVVLPAPSDLPDRTPKGEISPETYIGYERLQYIVTTAGLVEGAPSLYHFPVAQPSIGFAFGGSWTDNAEEATAGAAAELELGFQANDVYLVIGGSGTVDVAFNASATRTIKVSGPPKLYTLFTSSSVTDGVLLLKFTPGVQAYDFTFG